MGDVQDTCRTDHRRIKHCADCKRSPRDGVRLRELRLLTDPPGTVKHLCDGPDIDACVAIMRARASRTA